MELTENQRFWKAHLEAAESFDGTKADYARLHGLDKQKLYHYKNYFRSTATTSMFVQVKQTTQTTVSPSGVTVMLPNGVRFSLPDLSAPGLLERLARL